MRAARRDRLRTVCGGLVTTCAVMLLGIAGSRVVSVGPPWEADLDLPGGGSPACAVAQLRLVPALDYSAADQGYVVASVTVEEIPAECVGRSFRLTFSAADGSTVAEVDGASLAHRTILPVQERPRADLVASTALTVTGGPTLP